MGAGLAFMAWLFWNAQAQGVDPELLRTGEAIVVADSGPFLRFSPRAPSSTSGLIFLPGAAIDPTAYVPLLRAVADAGHPAVLVPPWRMARRREPDHRMGADLGREPPSRSPLAASGHSRGAALSARFAGAYPDQLAGLVLIGTTHPKRGSLETLAMPVIKIYGTRDCVADSASVLANASLLPAGTRWVRIEGANHQQFGWYGAQLGDCSATISRDTQQARTLEVLRAALDAIDAGN
jgi:pimeloyl-ACP methyl ester carboxylesterase